MIIEFSGVLFLLMSMLMINILLTAPFSPEFIFPLIAYSSFLWTSATVLYSWILAFRNLPKFSPIFPTLWFQKKALNGMALEIRNWY